MPFPTPHGDKLRALVENEKLPEGELPRVRTAIERYRTWLRDLDQVAGTGEELIKPMVDLLDEYKRSIDVDLIFDSDTDFLYRQKGQLKLDNTVVEEFMPRLVGRVFADRLENLDLVIGPTNCFSHLRFDSDLRRAASGGGMAIRSKNQDFAMARPLFLKASHQQDFEEALEAQTCLAYIAAEIKTNLDKTMFQEAAATAYDLKLAVPNARYFLLCEWLDMTPISTTVTAIEEVIILRKAKRLPSNVRREFSTAEGRARAKDDFERYLTVHPLSPDAFRRFLQHIETGLGNADEDEDIVLGRGWF